MPPRPRKPRIPDFTRLVATPARHFVDSVRVGVKDFTDKEAKIFREKILRQRFSSFRKHPLNPTYKSRKRRLGLSTRVMVATGHYVRSIKVYHFPGRNRDQWIIGIHPNTRARDKYTGQVVHDLPLADVAIIQEFGSSKAGIPARPHWREQRELIILRAGQLARRMGGRRIFLRRGR